MTNKQEFIIEGIVCNNAIWLMEERSMTLQVTLTAIYISHFFEKLQNSYTGLCSKISAYSYGLLIFEIENGKIVPAKI